MEESVKVWSNQVEQLFMISKDLIKLSQNIETICDQIKTAFLNVCVKIEKVRYYFEIFLRYNIISNPETTPAALLAVEMENLTKRNRANLIMRVLMMYDSLKKIQEVYDFIDVKVGGLRVYFDGLFKVNIEPSIPIEEEKLTVQNNALPFKVLRPDILTMIEGTKVTYESFIADLQITEDNFDSTMQNGTLSTGDTKHACVFKLLLINSRTYTNEAIDAYNTIATAFDRLQVFIDDYQKENRTTLLYIGSMVPRLETVRLALQIPNPQPSEASAENEDEACGHQKHRSR